jgi:hypothetical protein
VCQSLVPFTLVVTQDRQTAAVADGSTVTLPASALGQFATATLAMTYRGTGPCTITRLELTGPSEFSLPDAITLPVPASPGQPIALTIRYRPSTSARSSGRLLVAFDEAAKLGTFSLNLTGTAPELVFSYVQAPAGNTTLLASGDLVRFPDTAVRSTSTMAITLTNRGSGSGTVNSVAVQGAGFQASGLPLMPAALEAGRDLRFNVVFSPTAIGNASGGVTADIGRTVNFALSAKAVGAEYGYELLLTDGTKPVLPDSEFALPDVPVGQHATLAVRVRNRGNAEGKITSITVAGTGYQVSDLPFLPVTVASGAAFVFTLDFTSAQPGRFAGRLRVGDDSFQLTAFVLGSALQYSYESGSGQVLVVNGGNVLFPPAPVGSSTVVRFSIRNTGTVAAPLSTIAIAGGTGFTLTDLPQLPVSLRPDQSIGFTITAVPASVSTSNGTLRIDQLTMNLSVSGQPPPALPAYRFTGASGSADPLQQVAVGLSLTAPYSLPVKGVMTLSFVSDAFGADPSVQFAAGGKTVNFEIPANSTTAVFPGNATQVRFQTGTVAGAINLTATFSYEGTTPLTPAASPAMVLAIPQSAPRIISAQVASRSASGLTLLVSGYATGRSIQQMEFEFVPITGLSLTTSRFTMSSDAAFSSWYQSTTSQQFGSLFTVSIPFTGTVSTGQSLADVLETVRVRVSNQQGASGLYELGLR